MDGEREGKRKRRQEGEGERKRETETDRETDRDGQKGRDRQGQTERQRHVLAKGARASVISHLLQFHLILVYAFEARFMSKKQSKISRMAFDCCHRFMESNGLFSLLN